LPNELELTGRKVKEIADEYSGCVEYCVPGKLHNDAYTAAESTNGIHNGHTVKPRRESSMVIKDVLESIGSRGVMVDDGG
jgi:hypothetical protein